MTEAEWLACEDPKPMVAHIRSSGSARKLRLFACACCYRVYTDGDGPEFDGVTISERYADGQATDEELKQAEDDLDCGDYRYGPADYATSGEIDAVLGAAAAATWIVEYNAAHHHPGPGLLADQERLAQAVLLRDIFGNPFRPVAVDPAWLTSAVVALAGGIYADRAFDRLPILADALQDAGCDSDDVLDHCRGPGPHVRGCWVVDLLLGKS